MAESREKSKYLESMVYQVSDLRAHPPETGCYEPILAKLKEIWEAGRRDALEEQWISPKDRLPDEDAYVLVTVACESEDHDGVTQRWEEVHEAILYTAPSTIVACTAKDGEYMNEEILGWQPMPEPKAVAIRALEEKGE